MDESSGILAGNEPEAPVGKDSSDLLTVIGATLVVAEMQIQKLGH